jgi:hypothetical protein
VGYQPPGFKYAYLVSVVAELYFAAGANRRSWCTTPPIPSKHVMLLERSKVGFLDVHIMWTQK